MRFNKCVHQEDAMNVSFVKKLSIKVFVSAIILVSGICFAQQRGQGPTPQPPPPSIFAASGCLVPGTYTVVADAWWSGASLDRVQFWAYSGTSSGIYLGETNFYPSPKDREGSTTVSWVPDNSLVYGFPTGHLQVNFYSAKDKFQMAVVLVDVSQCE
jgi:hypothetical protein